MLEESSTPLKEVVVQARCMEAVSYSAIVQMVHSNNMQRLGSMSPKLWSPNERVVTSVSPYIGASLQSHLTDAVPDSGQTKALPDMLQTSCRYVHLK